MPHTHAWADRMPCSATLSVACTQVPRPISQRSGLRWSGPGRCAIMITGTDAPLTPAQVKAADSAVPAGQLAAAADAWQRPAKHWWRRSTPTPAPDLAAELDDYDDARDLITRSCARTPADRTNGTPTRPCRAALAAHGLDVAIDFCISERVPVRGRCPA